MDATKQTEQFYHSLPDAQEVAQRRLLTRQELLASFQFSQGGISLQHFIFIYLKNLHPELSLPSADSWALEDSSLKAAELIVNDTTRHPLVKENVRGALNSELGTAKDELNYPPANPYLREELVNEIAPAVVKRDLKFLDRPGGRAYVVDTTGHYNPYKDSWRSDLCYFGFLGNTTGLDDFDQMFAEVAAYWRERLNGPSLVPEENDEITADDVRRVVAIFNENHTNMPDLLVELPPRK